MKDKNTMEEQEFKEYIENTVNLKFFEAVSKFKSVCRAFRRGHITNIGYIIPNRPYHNRKNTCKRRGKSSRAVNDFKKKAYADIRKHQIAGV